MILMAASRRGVVLWFELGHYIANTRYKASFQCRT